MTSRTTALAALAAPVLIMTSFSLWRHLLLSWPHPPLWTYVHSTYVRTDTLPHLTCNDSLLVRMYSMKRDVCIVLVILLWGGCWQPHVIHRRTWIIPHRLIDCMSRAVTFICCRCSASVGRVICGLSLKCCVLLESHRSAELFCC